MDTQPLTASSLGRFYHVDGRETERCYKHHLSDYKDWDQRVHSKEWTLLAQNIGPRLAVDETQIGKDVCTVLSNKDGHGRKGSIVATVRGTKAADVIKIIRLIAEEQRCQVESISMDFSESMYNIAQACFPNAMIIVDCFHAVKRLCEGIEEMRIKSKRQAVVENKKAAAAFAKKEDEKAKRRAYYRKTHKRKPGENRGRKRLRKRVYHAEVLNNGDTKVELLTRSRNLLTQSGDKWGEHKKERARLLFELYPQIKQAYSIVCKFRDIKGKFSMAS